MRIPRIGELDRRVRLRGRRDYPYRDAELESEFPEQKLRWAKIEPVGAAVYSGSVQIDEKVTHRIYLRYLDGVTNDYEVVYREQVFRVKRVGDVKRGRRFTVLEVEELGNGR
ncbi:MULTISPECIES: phage head closure protein [unclassified Burkholderia]|uniref:phage head closure protein n=1 Tax=unclassified Burkholderia TaxID=2613784 RepID=UPI000B7A5C80|nr:MULTISPECIES: phage head closure protein [unclassified Burkholderia]MBR8234247.1 phage head closure protein [Burkholderia sp. AU32357]OXI45271.1 phage head-tail joining protein [Burkholderia sp. AU17457]